MLEKAFDECDFWLDKDREDNLAVWTDETYIAAQPDLEVFSSKSTDRSAPNLLKGLNKCVMCLMYHDAKSSQDSVVGYLPR